MKSKQWENAQYNENSLLFNTYSRSQKQRQHTQPESLKLSNQNLKSQQEKKILQKRQLFCLPRPMLSNWERCWHLPSPTGGFFYIQQVELDGWLCQETIACPELSLSDKIQDPLFFFFLFLPKYFLQNSKPKCTVFKASFL